MDKYKETLLSILNIALIFGVIICIVIGLYFLGIFKMPEVVEKIFFGSSQSVSDNPDNSNSIYSGISGSNNVLDVTKPNITPENLKQLLQNVIPKNDYSHEVLTSLYSGTSFVSKKITMRKQDGFYQVLIYDNKEKLEKEIQEYTDTVDITYYDESQQVNTVNQLPVANFNMADQTGTIITHEYFLESLSQIDSSSYDFSFENFGSVVRLTFMTSIEDYVQKQIYWLSLDYGVVVKAQTYENDAIVYEMKTIALTDI